MIFEMRLWCVLEGGSLRRSSSKTSKPWHTERTANILPSFWDCFSTAFKVVLRNRNLKLSWKHVFEVESRWLLWCPMEGLWNNSSFKKNILLGPWQVLDTWNYGGLPQRRSRVWIIGTTIHATKSTLAIGLPIRNRRERTPSSLRSIGILIEWPMYLVDK